MTEMAAITQLATFVAGKHAAMLEGVTEMRHGCTCCGARQRPLDLRVRDYTRIGHVMSYIGA
jgi:hypothetical protein